MELEICSQVYQICSVGKSVSELVNFICLLVCVTLEDKSFGARLSDKAN